ncbi:Amino acid permease family protein [Hibiscus syriacus]|uniref:Amino acid permease family protein n=1 Tax=Hibiscus syriacus TaxID=106335 RepID=A0A6A2ZMB7_HIBSY|nr:Amino acid permease family protein [Hibiscus syriacus]
METDNPIIEDPNSNTNEVCNRHSSSTSSRSSSSLSFLSHNGFGSSQFSDVETTTVKSDGSYTSLRDLLPRGSSSPVMCSLTTSTTADNSSWIEIPIKNPLLKHAALAYLQPVGNLPPAAEKGFLGGLKERCCRECGCILWIFDVVSRNVKILQSRETTIDDDEVKVE